MTKEPRVSLVPLLRHPAYLSPEDSLIRAVETLRFSGMDLLPVVGPFGDLVGVFDMRCLRPLLGREDGELRMTEPLAYWMRRPESFGRADMTLNDVLDRLTAGGDSALFIVDRDERYVGAVTVADILSPAPIPVRPQQIGGMATPWGVYLTNGGIQAGVGNLALVASGALMGVMLFLSFTLVGLLCYAAQTQLGWPLYDLYRADTQVRPTVAATASVVLQSLSLPLFLLLMRFLPLSGYHAAEHQAVHAMERGETLLPEVVKRMPRVHPRCGTNVMAGATVFMGVSQVLQTLQIGLGAPDSAIIGALAALFTWRSFGAFLQQHFTTRPASDKQIASGIAAAEDLQRKFLSTEPRRPTFWKRLWCMGFLQMIVGTGIASWMLYFIVGVVERYNLLPG
jgi:CBS domain-containing protein